MRFFKILILFAFSINLIYAQYKNSGIKTSLSARSQLALNETKTTYFVPATVYTEQYADFRENYVVHTTQAPPLDPVADFINKTRSKMASGVCYKEVPTSTLIHGSKVVEAGNGTTPLMSKIQVCCPGYEQNPHIFSRCEPVCKNDCINGICTAPNTCVCLPGHVQDHEGNCVATCPVGCANGFCEDNGECRCKIGYILEPTTKKFCIPHCKNSCGHGRCQGPDDCACNEGYRQNDNHTCEPICESCDHGDCEAPGVCVCRQGYKMIDGYCEPVCSLGCEKGRCVAPDVCECPYELNLDVTGSKCLPYCSRSCVNGICLGRNVCQCNEGYEQDPTDWSLCKPVCSPGCPPGYCSAPNLCCSPGSTKSGIKGRKMCVVTS